MSTLLDDAHRGSERKISPTERRKMHADRCSASEWAVGCGLCGRGVGTGVQGRERGGKGLHVPWAGLTWLTGLAELTGQTWLSTMPCHGLPVPVEPRTVERTSERVRRAASALIGSCASCMCVTILSSLAHPRPSLCTRRPPLIYPVSALSDRLSLLFLTSSSPFRSSSYILSLITRPFSRATPNPAHHHARRHCSRRPRHGLDRLG